MSSSFFVASFVKSQRAGSGCQTTMMLTRSPGRRFSCSKGRSTPCSYCASTTFTTLIVARPLGRRARDLSAFSRTRESEFASRTAQQKLQDHIRRRMKKSHDDEDRVVGEPLDHISGQKSEQRASQTVPESGQPGNGTYYLRRIQII